MPTKIMDHEKNIANDSEQNLAHAQILQLFDNIKRRRKVFYWVLPITFVLASILILLVPRRYSCKVVLAPETQQNNAGNSIQSLVSAFGMDMRNLSNPDALYPMIYPELVSSPNFLITLFDVPVSTTDDTFQGTYYQYLLSQHKEVFWKRWKAKVMSWITPKESTPIIANTNKTGVDVFCMSKIQWHAIYLMQGNIRCSVDKKTDVITFDVEAQDKLVCAIVADSVCAALQSFITDYRTKKVRTDLNYYNEMLRNSYAEYQQASKDYINYIDSHSNMKLERYRTEAKNLETEMDMKFSVYTSFQKQQLATQARLQENTPVFTVIQSASVPLKASGPKRMLFVLAMLILATGITCCVLCKDQLIAMFL